MSDQINQALPQGEAKEQSFHLCICLNDNAEHINSQEGNRQ